MKDKKKILFVITTLYNGGAEKSLISLLQNMDLDRYEVDLLILKKIGIFMEDIPEKVRILDLSEEVAGLYGNHVLPTKKRYQCIRLIGSLIAKCSTGSFLRQRQIRWKYFYQKNISELKKQYDIAIAYIEGEPLYFIVDKVKAKKKIAWIHNDYQKFECDRKFDLLYLKKVDHIVSVSELCVSILKKVFPEYAQKISYIPNLVSSNTIKEFSEKFYPKEFENHANILLSIGRLHPQKGFDMAIDAAKIMKDHGYSFIWFILGDGELQKDLEDRITKNDLKGTVVLLGIRQNPYPYIRYCDIFVQPSRFEGKSIVLDEAKILAKPILVTNYSTVGDQIIKDKEGIVVEMEAAEIAKGLEKLMDAKEQREKLTNYLSKFDYGNEKEIAKYYEIMEEI